MSNGITEQVVDHLTNLPDGMRNPVGAASVMLAGTSLILAELGLYRRYAAEQFAVDFRGNGPLLDQAITETTGKAAGNHVHGSTSRRFGSRILMITGISIAAGSAIASPSYNTTVDNDQAATVAVIDSSISMRNTLDMGADTSRYKSSVDALSQTSYNGSLAVIEFGADRKVSIPLTRDWKGQTANISEENVNPIGGNILETFDLAASLLPVNVPSLAAEKGPARSGTIVVVSDGTVEGSPEAIAAKAKSLKDEGITVKVVVPGTQEATYAIDGSEPVQSGADPEIFKAFGEENVIVAVDSQAVSEAITGTVEKSGKTETQQPWRVPFIAGIAIASVGFIKDGWQRVTRNV